MQDREERGGVERGRTRGEEEGVACWLCHRSIKVVTTVLVIICCHDIEVFRSLCECSQHSCCQIGNALLYCTLH